MALDRGSSHAMARRVLAGLFGLAGCRGGSPERPAGPVEPTPPGTIPARTWITDAQPWRLPRTHCIATGGDHVALVAGDAGWLTWVDLRSGTRLRDRRVGSPATEIDDVARLGDGRWLVVATEGQSPRQTTVAFTVDDDTLEVTPIALGVEDDAVAAMPRIAQLADGGVVITGRGLPLAIYNPKS